MAAVRAAARTAEKSARAEGAEGGAAGEGEAAWRGPEAAAEGVHRAWAEGTKEAGGGSEVCPLGQRAGKTAAGGLEAVRGVAGGRLGKSCRMPRRMYRHHRGSRSCRHTTSLGKHVADRCTYGQG